MVTWINTNRGPVGLLPYHQPAVVVDNRIRITHCPGVDPYEAEAIWRIKRNCAVCGHKPINEEDIVNDVVDGGTRRNHDPRTDLDKREVIVNVERNNSVCGIKSINEEVNVNVAVDGGTRRIPDPKPELDNKEVVVKVERNCSIKSINSQNQHRISEAAQHGPEKQIVLPPKKPIFFKDWLFRAYLWLVPFYFGAVALYIFLAKVKGSQLVLTVLFAVLAYLFLHLMYCLYVVGEYIKGRKEFLDSCDTAV